MAAYIPFYVPIKLNGQEIQNFKVEELLAQPTGGELFKNRVWFYGGALYFYDGTTTLQLATGASVETAVLQATAATKAGVLFVSGGADRSRVAYAGEAGILKTDADGVVSKASAGTDYVTGDSSNTLTNKTIDANGTGNSISNLEVADFASSAKTSDLTTSALSSQFATADAIKSYVDNQVTSLGSFAGDFDASGGTLPTTGTGLAGAIAAGDYWRVSVAGTITGLGPDPVLEVSDVLVAKIDGADAASEFFALQGNITDMVSNPGASTDNAIAKFDGATGKAIQNSNVTISDDGTVNIPTGQTYNINGSAHTHTLDALTDVIAASTNLAALMAKTDKHVAAFNDTTDWVGASAPYTFTLAAATHGIAANAQLITEVKDSSGDKVGVAVNVANASGDIVVTSMVKFAGSLAVIG